MKRLDLTLLLAFSVGGAVHGGPSIFLNLNPLTTQTNVVASTFVNRSVIDFVPLATNISITLYTDPFSDQLFQTHQTKYWTNAVNGSMVGQPGWEFCDFDTSGKQPSVVFNNAGLIQAYDLPMLGFQVYQFQTGNAPTLYPTSLTPIGINGIVPSSTLISAQRVENTGTIQVGDQGLLQISGQNLQLGTGTLLAGTVDEDPSDSEATMARGLQVAYISGSLYYFYSPPVDVYDIFWGATNSENFTDNLEGLSSVYSGPTDVYIYDDMIFLGSRNGTVEGAELHIDYGWPVSDVLPMSGSSGLNSVPFRAGNFVPYVQEYSEKFVAATSNYVGIVLVNSAFLDTNITVNVGIYPGSGDNVVTNSDEGAFEYLVRFAAPITDVATGETVTNAIYVIDSGALQMPAQDSTNAIYLNDAKANSIEIVRQEPVEWETWLEEQTSYPFITGLTATQISSLIYTNGESQNATGNMNCVTYGAMIGRNPEQPDGMFPFTASLLGTNAYDMPDLTNEPGRIAINAAKVLDVSGMTLRANGVTTISTPKLTGSPAATDFGDLLGQIGSPNAGLTVSNLIPSKFNRLRGDVLVWSTTWLNVITNVGGTNQVTNYMNYHLLVVDQELRSSFTPSSLKLNLKGTNIVLSDQVNVIGAALFDTPDLVVNAPLRMTGNSPNLYSTNLPMLKNLLIGTNGSVSSDQLINLDVAYSASPVDPLTTTYSIETITNLNSISSGVVELQARHFANGGEVSATTGEILINSKSILLGAGRGLANTLTAGSDISLYAGTIQLTNASIMAGQSVVGQVTLYAANELTDFHSGAASTNTYRTNLIRVTDGFSLPVKPASGDLFGTEITTTAAQDNQLVRHYWAGQDLGATAAGFLNNVVIGHLVIDRTSPSATLQFSGTGANKAMYVDYLDLEDLASSDYHNQHGLVVDPNFKIYFANANVDPAKLYAVYSNIVWVPHFAGPNSSTVVKYENGGTCVMNAALAVSSDISSDFSGIPNDKSQYPLDNPNPYVGAIPCPSLITATEELFVTTNNGFPQTLVIWTTGEGSITPALTRAKVGQTLTLTAAPAPGWTFLNWSGGEPSTLPSISFTIPATNAALTANFVSNVIPELAGSYNGLFYQSNGIAANSSGFVSFSVASTGTASGALLIGTAKYAFTSRFYGSGQAMARATNGTNVVTITLQLDTTNLSDMATGSVANGSWEAGLSADCAPVWSSSKPAPQTGYYTTVLPGNANAGASPGGDSYGTLTVNNLGGLSFVGTLADGTAVSQSVPVSKEGQWPLYFAPSSGGVLLGWVTFNNIGLGGTVNWFKAPGASAYYPAGFNTNSVLLGDKYAAPANGTTGLNFTNATLTLSGGNLAAALSAAVKLSGKATFASTNPAASLIVNAKTGGFAGQYAPAGGGQKISFTGVVLPNEQMARGFFLGSSQSGKVLLQGQ